jgi:hypothetical protein
VSTLDERNVNPVEEMRRIAQIVMDLASWGFTESYRSTKPGELIYDSELCRISLIWEGWDALDGNSMSIRYGRLHAPDEKNTMFWNGEESRCWHRVEYPLHFLDGRAPAEAAKLDYSHAIKTAFNEDEVRKKLTRHQPDWLAQIHVTIWQRYGNRLFELFDLRKSELWQQYRQFLKEVYDIRGRNSAIRPSLDKVC